MHEMSKSVGVTVELAMYVGQRALVVRDRLSNPVEPWMFPADKHAA
jgi:hypothetical protein